MFDYGKNGTSLSALLAFTSHLSVVNNELILAEGHETSKN